MRALLPLAVVAALAASCKEAATSAPTSTPDGATTAPADAGPPPLDPEIVAIRDAVSGEHVLSTITSLVSFGTRNVCSEQASKTHGIGAARDFLRDQLSAVPGLDVRLHEFPQAGCAGATAPTTQNNVVATLAGNSKSRLIVVGGHYDSRTVNVVDGTSPAPGANDSGSQSAVVVEVARVLAGHSFEATLVFVTFAGEEQGLVGSAAMVKDLSTLFPDGKVEAMLNCDIVGGDATANDAAALQRFRLFSPGTPREVGKATPDGTPDDTSPSRGLMRFVGTWGARYVPSMTMLPQLREDRPGRGGDHESFLAAGSPAVRFIEANETIAHQHSEGDTLANMTPAYAARMAQVVATTAAALARAPLPPSGLTTKSSVESLSVAFTGSASANVDHYVVAVRDASENLYHARVNVRTRSETIARTALSVGETFYLSVAAVDAAGHESLFAYPELRCDSTGCAAPADANDVTAVTK